MDLVVGRVVKAHGIRGEVVVDIRTDEPAERYAVGTVLRGRRREGVRDIENTYTVAAAREHSGRLLLRLEGVASRDGAAALRGTVFVIDSATLGSPEDPEEYYDHQLVGLEVRAIEWDDAAEDLDDEAAWEESDGGYAAGTSIGAIIDVVHGPAGDTLVVDASGREVLVPFVHAIVPVVDPIAGYVLVDAPEGLFDEDAAVAPAD